MEGSSRMLELPESYMSVQVCECVFREDYPNWKFPYVRAYMVQSSSLSLVKLRGVDNLESGFDASTAQHLNPSGASDYAVAAIDPPVETLRFAGRVDWDDRILFPINMLAVFEDSLLILEVVDNLSPRFRIENNRQPIGWSYLPLAQLANPSTPQPLDLQLFQCKFNRLTGTPRLPHRVPACSLDYAWPYREALPARLSLKISFIASPPPPPPATVPAVSSPSPPQAPAAAAARAAALRAFLALSPGENWRVPKARLAKIKGGTNGISSLAFAPSGEWLAFARLFSSPETAEIALFSPVENKEITLSSSHNGRITSLCFSPDETILVSSSSDHSVKIFSLEASSLGTPLAEAPHSDSVLSIAFMGSSLFSACRDGGVRGFNPPSPPSYLKPSSQCYPTCLAAREDFLFSGLSNGQIALIRVERKGIELFLKLESLIESPGVIGGHIRDIAVLKAYDLVLILGESAMKAIDPRSHRGVLSFKGGVSTPQSSRLAISPDGQTVLTGLDNGEVGGWDIATGNPVDLDMMPRFPGGEVHAAVCDEFALLALAAEGNDMPLFVYAGKGDTKLPV